MEFRKYTLDDLETVRFYSAKVETLSYYYTACNIDLYSKAKDIYIAEEESLFVYFNKDKVFLMPFTEKSNINKTLSRLYSYTQKNGLDFKVIDIPEEYYPYIDQEKFSLRRDRDSDEYIYLREKLITLQGKHLQSKRNHISQFVKAYPEFSISKLTKENYSECIQMDEVWLKNCKEQYRSACLQELVFT